jgi:pre-mRNA-splicing helicase BRR2
VKPRLDFVAPTVLGSKPIHFMCNACLECDQEYEFTIDVKEAVDDAEDGKPMDE